MTPQRFVQFPTDTERSAALGFEATTSASVTVGLPAGPLDDARQAQLLGALLALLTRYTQPQELCVDVFIRDAAGARPFHLDVEVAADATASSLIDAARRPPEAHGSPSNVGATFLLAPLESIADIGAASSDLHFLWGRRGDQTLLTIVSNSRLVHPATVSRLLESYVTLLTGALAEPTTAIHQLPLLSGAELRALTTDEVSCEDVASQQPAVRRFEALARQQPDAPAVSFHGEHLTYSELDRRSSQLAQTLLAHGVGLGTCVAVCVRPSVELLVAALAIWKARGIYLPIDPTHPAALIAHMLEDANPRLALTTAPLAPLLGKLPRLCFDADAALLRAAPTTAPFPEPALTDAACLFFTSGTTGRAKGVVTTQGNVAHALRAARHRYGFRPSDVFVSLARYTFSISLFELLSPLCSGGSVRLLERDEVLSPERLCLALQGATVIHAGPSLLGSLFRHLGSTPGAPRTLPGLRHASSGGDLVPPSVMEEMKRVFPNAELFVIYGCTEISCMGTTFPIERETTVNRTMVGKAFPDVTVRVVDASDNLVPLGVVGEICFAGKGVAVGYLARPELNAEKFVELDGRRFYRTGDVGRVHPDGSLEILGRRDFQVQVRGIRVELVGIERVVVELGLAAQCAVVAVAPDAGELRLVAFVVKPRESRAASFRRALALQLPDYMLPHHVVVLDAMPLTANGKLDRNRLKEMPWDTQLGVGGGTAPANERERQVAEVFARVLGLDEVGVEDSFFDLGGDSLLAVLALEELTRALGVTFPPQVLFEGGTVRALASRAPGAADGLAMPILLNSECSAPRLFMLSGIHTYRALAAQLDGRCRAYGVFAQREVGALDAAAPRHSVEELALDCVELIRRQQPAGPYRLLGYSFAGLVAYEVARQLRAAGQEVRFLGLVDAVLPEWTRGYQFRLSQLRRLRSAPPRDVMGFVLRRLGRRRPKPGDAFARYQDDERVGPLEEQRDLTNRRAAAQYLSRMGTFSGNATLIVSGERLRMDPLKSPSCGWAPFLPQLEVQSVQADHFRMMSDAPWVSQVADIVVRAMERAER